MTKTEILPGFATPACISDGLDPATRLEPTAIDRVPFAVIELRFEDTDAIDGELVAAVILVDPTGAKPEA